MAPVPEKVDSVYDFLYVDRARISLFLSQFSQYGHLTSLTRAVTSSTGRGGGVDLKLVSVETSEGAETALQKHYDPQWLAPLTFLDQAQQRGMIVRGLENAAMGQIVLTSGLLEVRDLRLIQKAMNLPSMRQMHKADEAPAPGTTRADRRRQAKAGSTGAANTDSNQGRTEFGMDFLALLPHAVQAQLHSSSGTAWCSLNEDGLVVPSSDLFLKHGVKVPGDWHVLGVLDAFPEGTEDAEEAEERFQQAQAAIPSDNVSSVITLAVHGFAGFIDGIVPFARLLLGRRDSHFGVTPLLIFREVASD